MVEKMTTTQLMDLKRKIRFQWRYKLPLDDTRLKFLFDRAHAELKRRHFIFAKDECPYGWWGCGTHAQCLRCELHAGPPID